MTTTVSSAEHTISEPRFTRQRTALALAVIAASALVTFFYAVQLNFVGDDWIFLDIVGRLNPLDYLVKYFDPTVQTAWYRPVQGIQYLIGYQFFGSDPFGYHLENVLIHLVNAWLLFAIVSHVTKKWNIALIAGLLYATFPIAVEGIFKAGVIDPLLAVFSLLSIWFWLRYLERGASRDYWLAFVTFILALYCKEISIMLPVILFLVDRLYVRKPTALADWVRRYSWFALAFVPYLPIEYIVTRRSVFVSHEGYTASLQVLANLVDYSSGLAFPWLLPPPFTYVVLVGAVALLAYLVLWRKQIALICLLAVAILPVLPIAPFPQVSPRFLYFSLTASAFGFALGFDWIWRWLSRVGRVRWLALVLVALVVVAGSIGVDGATTAFAEFSREMRITFRNIRQDHPTFPNNTLLYFIDPPLPGPDLSGMFFSRYGRGVVVGANDGDQPAHLRDHPAAYVYTFDSEGNQIEHLVDESSSVRSVPAAPVDFAVPIRLEGYELVSSTIKRGEPIILLLYWRSLKPVTTDYSVFVHLSDQNDNNVAGYEKEPRGGKSHMTAWIPGQRVVDAVVLPLPDHVPAGAYRLEVGLVDSSTDQPVPILDSQGHATAANLLIQPLVSPE